MYCVTFDLWVSKSYPVIWNFRSIDIQGVSKVYPVYFDMCVYKHYILMIRANSEISSVLFISFQFVLWKILNFHLP